MLLPIFLAMLVLGIVSFVLGWFAANSRERRAYRASRRDNQVLQRRLNAMGTWVRENWPDEYAAYHRGHTEGYQQGVLHAADLEADSEFQNA